MDKPVAITAQLRWQRGPAEAFTDQRYARRHTIAFDGGMQVAASSSPHVVRTPMSDASAVDPEELFVASLASCHLLWFLSLAAAAGHVVEAYEDEPLGTMRAHRFDDTAAARGHGDAAAGAAPVVMAEVVLRPRVRFAAGTAPDDAALAALHEAAHRSCFIANSVRTEVRCEPRW